MQYRAAVCDDMAYYAEEIKKAVAEFCAEKEKQIDVEVFGDGEALLKKAEKERYDLYLLDVEMPGLNGIEAAQRIRAFDLEAVFIFITSHEQFSLSAARVEAMGYLVKPLDRERLFRLLHKSVILLEGLSESRYQERRYLEIVCDYNKITLDLGRVVYIYKERNKLYFHMEDGKEYSCYDSFKHMMTVLPRNVFCKTGGSFVVNLRFVREAAGGVLLVESRKGTQTIPVKRSLTAQIQKELAGFRKRRRLVL